jgi:hypothetical protein
MKSDKKKGFKRDYNLDLLRLVNEVEKIIIKASLLHCCIKSIQLNIVKEAY